MAAPQKVRAGETWQPRASDHNAFVEATQIVERIQRSGGAGVGRSNWGSNVVQVRNDSGIDRDRFDVLGIDGPVIDPAVNPAAFKNGIVIKGVTPQHPTHEARFVVLLQPLAIGRIGWASIAGVTVAKVDFTDCLSCSCAEVKDGDAGSLQASSQGSAQILWPASGTGIEWAIVMLGSSSDGGGETHVLFELKTSLEEGGTATAYVRDPETLARTAETITVTDDIGDRYGGGADDCPDGDGNGATGKAIQFSGDDHYYVYDLHCPWECYY